MRRWAPPRAAESDHPSAGARQLRPGALLRSLPSRAGPSPHDPRWPAGRDVVPFAVSALAGASGRPYEAGRMVAFNVVGAAALLECTERRGPFTDGGRGDEGPRPPAAANGAAAVWAAPGLWDGPEQLILVANWDQPDVHRTSL